VFKKSSIGLCDTQHRPAIQLAGRTRYDEVARLLLEVVEGCCLKVGGTHPHTIESLNNLIELYEAWDKPEKAEEWREKLPQAEAVER